jgi:histidine triad (HIT) family protein
VPAAGAGSDRPSSRAIRALRYDLDVADCLFCAIAAGEVPSNEVLSTERVYAFKDLRPVAPTHVLVIPREHIVDAASIGDGHGEVLVEMFEVARRVAESAGLSERGSRLVLNVGPDSGNSVAHLHLHVLGGRRLAWPPG